MPAVLLNQIDQRSPKSERDMSNLIHARSLDIQLGVIYPLIIGYDQLFLVVPIIQNVD